MHKHDNYTFLTSAPVSRVVVAMAVPTIISMLVTSLYNMADTFLWGKSTRSLRLPWALSFR